MKNLFLKRAIALIVFAVMLLNAFPLTVAFAADGAGLKFIGGYENLYSTDKKLETLPSTFEATIKVPTSYSDQYWGNIFACNNDGADTNYMIWDVQSINGALSIRFFCGARNSGGSVTGEVIGRFMGALDAYKGKTVHVALVLDNQNNAVKLYLDGVEFTGEQAYTSSGTGVASASGLLSIYNSLDTSKMPDATIGGDLRAKIASSQWAVHHVDNYRYFRGEIYELALFSDVRTVDEIAADKNTLPKNADGIITCYASSELTSDETLKDLSGNGYDMKKRYVKPTGMSFGSGLESLYSTSKRVGALPLTYEMEVTLPTAPGDQYWGDIAAWYSGEANEHYFFVDVHAPSSIDLRILAGIRDASGNIVEEVIVKFVGALSEYRGQQVHISLTLDTQNKALKLYINGAEWKGTPTCTASGSGVASADGLLDLCKRLDVSHFADFSVGGDFRKKMPDSQYSVHHVDNWRFFRGLIHEIAIFTDVRTAAEIAADYNGVSKDPSLLMWFDFESSANSATVADKSANGYDLNGSPEWADAKTPITGYAYSFVVVGDTQVITRDESVTSAETYDPSFAGNFSKIYDWIIANKDSKNIQFSFHMGDITDWSAASEWELAMANIGKLNGEIPYNLVRGNHDTADAFVKNYTMDRFVANIANGEEYGSFDGNTLNTYQTLTVGNIKYLMLSLDLGPSKAIIEWANEVVASHPYHNVIISTHSYLHSSGAYMDDPLDCSATQYNPGGKYNGGDYNGTGDKVYWDYRLQKYKDAGEDYLYQDASYMWENLVKKYENICMVLCGHEVSDYILNVEGVGDHGNKIAQVLIDPQGVDRSLQAAGQGHAGLVAMLYFSEDGRTVQTEYYSTIRDQYYKDGINDQTITLDVVEMPTDSSDLHEEIVRAEMLKEFDYSVEDWAEIQAARDEAAKVVNSPDSTIEDYVNAFIKLRGVLSSKTPLDRTAINEAIAKAETYDKSKYTEDSWAAFEDALIKAKQAAEGRDQATMDAAKKTLTYTMSRLKKLKPAADEEVVETPTEQNTEILYGEKSGCGSSISATAALLGVVIVLGTCVAIRQREE